jgi:hypothetical protein
MKKQRTLREIKRNGAFPLNIEFARTQAACELRRTATQFTEDIVGAASASLHRTEPCRGPAQL